jgi:hypothetical protein
MSNLYCHPGRAGGSLADASPPPPERRLGGDVASIEAELDGRQRTMSKTNRGPIRRTIGPIFALALIAAGAFVVIALLFFAPGFRVGWLLGGFAMLFGGLCWAMGRLHQR